MILTTLPADDRRRKLHSKKEPLKEQQVLKKCSIEQLQSWNLLPLERKANQRFELVFTIGTDPVQKCASKVTIGKRHRCFKSVQQTFMFQQTLDVPQRNSERHSKTNSFQMCFFFQNESSIRFEEEADVFPRFWILNR